MNPIVIAIVCLIPLAAAAVWIRSLLQDRTHARQQFDRQLHDLEARRESLLHSAFDCVVIVDADGKIVEFNPAAETTFGFKRSEAVGRHLSELIIPTVFGATNRAEFMKHFTEGEEGWLGRRQEMSARRASGAEFPIEMMLMQVRSEGPAIFTGYIREITERIKGETALFERVNQAALNSEISAALARTDGLQPVLQRCAEAMIWHVDVALARIWVEGETPGEMEMVASAGMDSRIDGDDSRVTFGSGMLGALAQLRRPYQTNTLSKECTDTRMRVWAERQGVVSFAAYPLLVEERVVGLLGLYDRKPLPEAMQTNLATIVDGITQCMQRSRAEQHVREQAALLDKATDAIFLRDLAGHIIYWNKSSERIYGWSAAEAMAHRVSELLKTADPHVF